MQNWLMVSIFGYPVSEEQLVILNLLGLSGNVYLWLLRFLSLGVLTLSLWFWYRLLSSVINKRVANISVIIMFICPMFLILWLVYPLICVKLFIVSLALNLGIGLSKYKFWMYFFILSIAIILFNSKILGNNAAIFYKLSFGDAQTEVTSRISSEDSLKNDLKLPLWWRRAAYNKYFFAYKQVLAETLTFFDFESIFYQEINPLSQKSIVIFLWPEMYLFVFSLYFLVKFKNNILTKLLLVSLLLAWIDYVFSEGAVYRRLILIIFPVGTMVSIGYENLVKLSTKNNLLARFALFFVSVFILFGSINGVYDLSVRREYWMDNRPIAFEFWFREISKLDMDKFDRIQISSLVGNTRQYCLYYLGNRCGEEKFIFDSFDLSKIKKKNVLYAGFAGEFVGSRFKNDVSDQWVSMVKDTGITMFSTKSLRDTIAYKYGNDIGVGVIK